MIHFVAQTTQPVDPLLSNLTSISGILALTTIIVKAMQKYLGAVVWFQKVPVAAYAVLTAVALALGANYFGYLQGTPKDLIWQAIVGALGASGLYTWVTGKGLKPLSDVGDGPPNDVDPNGGKGGSTMLVVLLLLGISVTASGCAWLQQATPQRRYYDALLIRATVLDSLIQYRKAGVIDDAAYKEVDRYVKWSDSFVKMLEINPNDAGALDNLNGVIDQLIAFKLKYSQMKGPVSLGNYRDYRSGYWNGAAGDGTFAEAENRRAYRPYSGRIGRAQAA